MEEKQKLYMYLLISNKTGKIYLDDENICDVSLSEGDTIPLSKMYPDTRIEGPKQYTMGDLSSLCYAMGAKELRFHKDGQTRKVTLVAEKLRKAPYNHLTNQALCRAKQLNDFEQLLNLKDGFFFVPVRIDQQEEVEIYYVTAKHAKMEGESYFIAFTTFEEYQVWASSQKGYNPLKITYPSLRQIAGTHGWIINPKGNQLVLSDKILKMIDAGGENE